MHEGRGGGEEEGGEGREDDNEGQRKEQDDEREKGDIYIDGRRGGESADRQTGFQSGRGRQTIQSSKQK